MATKQQTLKLGITDLTDDALIRLRRTYQRGIEDGISGSHTYPRYIRAIRTLQGSRLRLKMRYGAVDDHVGTHIYDHYYRLDAAPSYKLATKMDHSRWQLGRSHVLDWDGVTRKLPASDPRRSLVA